MVVLLGALVALTGYTLIWDGALMVRGITGPARPNGPGILDLILPSRIAKLDAALAGSPSNASNVAPESKAVPGGVILRNPQTNVTIDPNTGQIQGQVNAQNPPVQPNAPGDLTGLGGYLSRLGGGG